LPCKQAYANAEESANTGVPGLIDPANNG
jgi:hypothetical protein